MAFSGWPREAFDVLARLQGDPSPSEREAVRPEREGLVRRPMVALLQDLAERDQAYADHSVWRYATTVPAWQRQGAAIRLERNVELGISLDLDGLRVQGAWWYAPPEQRDRYRDAVAGKPGVHLERAVRTLRRRSFTVGGDVMVRVPRGYPADHPRALLLRHRSVIAARRLGTGAWLHQATALDHVQAAAEELRPLLEWFCDHVAGIPTEP
ncbi:DUF2461 family protein [Microlunatus parietis]|uniref:Uncharacterized protein (DUF2461 family) n=1 Tax=Microlunatus parietis TaxID=682979 RepID=A0A7Y9LC55_9ACTN|nr:DUF2461 family protein [Microlunatus parietis]NYE71518.1 uncharacterized protein (DUF2461 family) [Microlunatus parietis]